MTPSLDRLTFFFACLMVGATWCLLFVGAMVTSTNSGLAVPDWPTTYGQNMFLYPLSEMKGGIFYEHGHRLFASLIGFLALVNAVLLGGRRPGAIRWLSFAALLLVVVQGVLGGLTVRMKLPMPVSAAHGGTAQLFFLSTLLLATWASQSWKNSARPLRFDWAAPGVKASLAFLVAGYAQILVGAVMRHSYAGLAIPTFPLAFGGWIPTFWNFGLVTHFIHTRILPLALVIFLLAALKPTWNAKARLIRFSSRLLALLFLLQVTLGASVIWTHKTPLIASLHLATGAALLACALFLMLWAGRLGQAAHPAAAALPQEMPAQWQGAQA